MSVLSQGLLADNSITPDVEIQECKTESARTRLKKAITKNVADGNTVAESVKTLFSKSQRVTQPVVAKQPKNSQHSENFLAYEVAKLANKLDQFEINSQLQQKSQAAEKTYELEKKISEITNNRLQFLEKLQQDQEQWKQQYMKTIEKLNENKIPQKNFKEKTDNLLFHQLPTTSANRFTMGNDQTLLKTPLPRTNIPQPSSTLYGGNGQFLKDLLNQNNASTPNLSQYDRYAPVDTVPVKLSQSHSVKPVSVPNLSPIKLSSSQLMAKEIENDVERQKIAEKFPHSFSKYLPISNASPVSHVLARAVAPSSLVAEYRAKLRRLIEMRTTLEHNLQAVQRKPQLDNFAIAALADQLEKEDWSGISDEKIQMCSIEKLVDEQIALLASKSETDLASEARSAQMLGKTSKTRHVKSKQAFKEKPTKKATEEVRKKKPAGTVMPKQITGSDETTLTHLYGKAEYHPHRTTVHQPFMHISPAKSPKFRTKRALQAIPVTHVRSEKSQTSKFSSPTILQSKYLAPTAVSLRPPQIHENDPDPVIISAAKPMMIASKSSPQKSPTKPKKVVILEESDELPGNETSFASSIVEQHPVTTDKLHLKGEGGRPRAVVRDSITPVAKPSPICPTVTDKIQQTSAEDKVKCWVEQEIMARILGQLYPPCDQHTQTVNLESEVLKRIIEDEIKEQIRQRTLHKPAETKPKEILSPQFYEPTTPVPTPEGTLTPSVSEESPPVVHHFVTTPVLSPQVSVSETEVSTPEPQPSHQPTPPPEEVEVTVVPTPLATPLPSSPEESLKEDSIVNSTTESVKDSPKSSLPDPWEGKNPEDKHMELDYVSAPLPLAPEPDLVDLVVRPVTPEPAPKKLIYSSTSESSESEDSPRTDDKTISEGQLIIEHGEMIPKKKPLQIPEDMHDLLNQNTLHNVADFEPASEGEFRPAVRFNLKPKKPFNYVEDDPTGIYTRPRKPLSASESEDISVGEIPGRKRQKFQKWKKSLQKSKPNVEPHAQDSNISVSDLVSTSAETSQIAEDVASGNVILVTSATSRNAETDKIDRNTNEHEDHQPDIILKDSLDDLVPRNRMTLTLPSTDPFSAPSDTDDISVHDL